MGESQSNPKKNSPIARHKLTNEDLVQAKGGGGGGIHDTQPDLEDYTDKMAAENLKYSVKGSALIVPKE